MAGLIGKIASYASSPQGRRMIGKARTKIDTPQNRAKAKEVVDTVRSKVGGTGPGEPPQSPR